VSAGVAARVGAAVASASAISKNKVLNVFFIFPISKD